jgi:RNA polymerase sigma factor (TIGR02999 family)
LIARRRSAHTDGIADDATDITALLRAWRRGDDAAYGRAAALLYADLRRRAARCLRSDGDRDAIRATGLVHEAFIRLVTARDVDWRDRVHFLAVATRTMRRVLVDLVRAGAASKRGARAVHVTLDSGILGLDGDIVEVLALEAALEKLAALDQRRVRVVELRYLGGLTVEETADALHVSPDTVARDWRLARAWLKRELGPGSAG